MEGWIKLHRSLLDWQWYEDLNVRAVFIHLLLTANHEDRMWMNVLVKRGQVVVGRIELAKSVGLSEQNIRTALAKLKSTNEITIKSTNKYSVISIINYNKYQSTNQQTNQPLTNNQPATNHKQEVKNERTKEVCVDTAHTFNDFLKENQLTELAAKHRILESHVKASYNRFKSHCVERGELYSNPLLRFENWLDEDVAKNPNLRIKSPPKFEPVSADVLPEDKWENGIKLCLERLAK